MRLLLPQPPVAGVRDVTAVDADELSALYAYPADLGDGQPWLRANFVASLDGAATGPDGRSGSINTEADREVFGLLRALADVVVVGAGTARVEGYRPVSVRTRWRAGRADRGQRPQPALAVVTRVADIPALLQEPREGAGPVLLITCTDAPPESLAKARELLGERAVIACGAGTVNLPAAVAELSARGLERILCEGGPHLMHDLTAAGCVDELCLTLAPQMVAGEHGRIAAGASVRADLVPRLLLESDGTLLGRWVRPDALTR